MRSAYLKPSDLLPRFAAIAVLALGLLAATAAQAGDVAVAVAANFLEPLKALEEGFTAETGHRLRISAGSTGELYSQIRNGAPFGCCQRGNGRPRCSRSPARGGRAPAPTAPAPRPSR